MPHRPLHDRYVQDVRSTGAWITEGGTPNQLNASPFFGGELFALRLPSLDLTPFSDNQAGHTGSGLISGPAGPHNDFRGSFALYQNGKKIAGGNAVKATGGFGDLQVSATLSPKPSVVKFVVTASRAAGRHFRLSATSRDVYTWHSRPQPGATIPAPWMCDFTPVLPSADRHCAVQPMMTLDYNVAGLSGNGCPPCAARHHWVLASGIGEWLVVAAVTFLFVLGRRHVTWLRMTTRVTVALLPVAIIWYLATTWVAWS